MPNLSQATIRFTCRICATEGDGEVHSLAELMYGTGETFDYIRCGHCGCLQIGNIPADLARHYPADYYAQQPRQEPVPLSGLKGALSRWYCRGAVTQPSAPLPALVRALLPVPGDFAAFGAYLVEARLHRADERILDVGCGASPHRLAAFRRCGFTAVEGVDPFIAADTVYHGVPVRRRTIDEIDGSFGLIMFHHSLEHVPDPLSTLRRAAVLLRPGGSCLVRIPVMGTWFWRRFGACWAELDAPRHLHLMSLQGLGLLARRAGFRVRKTVFDSEAWEIGTSLRYERGAAAAAVATQDNAALSQQADALNRLCDAGRACFYLEKV